jgi:hypothetical protein
VDVLSDRELQLDSGQRCDLAGALFIHQDIFDQWKLRSAGTSSLAQKPVYRAELHASRSLIPRLWVSGDAYYNVGGETRITEAYQGNAANTVRLGAGSGLRVWRGGEFVLNYEEVVARPSGQLVSRTYRLKFLQLWSAILVVFSKSPRRCIP